MISIVVAHHKETEREMRPLFSSIENQLGINFEDIEVLICNDADYALTDFSQYPNVASRVRNVSCAVKNHLGLSRQTGIEEAKGEYLTFCDADDALYSALTLYDLFAVTKTKKDFYNFRFAGEKDDGLFYIEPFNLTWIFGKLFRTEFLRKSEITCDPAAFWHEDTYMNLLIKGHNPTYEEVPEVMYIWRYNKNSITRSANGEYFFGSADMLLEIVIKALSKLKGVYPDQKIIEDAMHYLILGYWLTQGDKSLNQGKCGDKIEKACAALIEAFDLEEVCLDRKNTAYFGKQVSGRNKYNFLASEGFIPFVKRIKKEA